ncbi:MAG: hypothetical protein H7641_09560 [Candidatus Heimdallarchaeota archaeon]|nr:hypothetical protein [Candidatus Heimdallarchaeota archaeon]MCK4877810.1 hypothetical protein [Candidatus Heimdallarchaeota archaeon]
MEKSYDENLAKLMSEARDLFKSENFADSARKYLEAAKNQESARGMAQAEDLYHEAIKNFIRASEENKEKKQFRMSAQNLYYVVQIFKKLGVEEDWKAATSAVVDDLVNAAQEYLMWNEYDRGIILISTACFFLFSTEEFQTAEQLYLKYVEQIKDDPGFTRAQQILFAAGHAIKAIKDSDTTSLLNAQQLVGSHLKPGLSQIVGDLFFPAIDDAMDNVVKIFRSKIKLPKIIPELKLSKDLVLNEPADLTIYLENEGQGDAFNLIFKLNLPEGLEILEGNKEFTLSQLLAQETYEYKLVVRGMSGIGEVTHELNANITFQDQLQTKQTMMIGPYDLIFREKSLVRELEVDLVELSEKNTKLQKQMAATKVIPEEATRLMIDFVTTIIRESEEVITKEEFETVRANIKSIEYFHELIQTLTSDKFIQPLLEARENTLNEKVEQAKIELTEELNIQFENQKQKEIEEYKQSFNSEKETEQKELMEKLDEDHQNDITELRDEFEQRLQNELDEQRLKFEDEKKKVLEEQEAVLRGEFQKLLSESQEKKRR